MRYWILKERNLPIGTVPMHAGVTGKMNLLGRGGYGKKKSWKTVKEEAGIGELRIHDLRHTYASLAVNPGSSLYEVQKMLGHSSSQVTQRYRSVFVEMRVFL